MPIELSALQEHISNPQLGLVLTAREYLRTLFGFSSSLVNAMRGAGGAEQNLFLA